MNNNRFFIFLPFLLALMFAGGMWLQKFLSPAANGYAKLSKYDEITNLISERYVEAINIDSLTDEMMPFLFEKLDPHSSYISAEDYRDLTDPIRGSFEGIGVQFNIQNDTVVIVQVLRGGPSEKLNIHAGDRIVTVNDSTIAGNGITNEKVVKLLKGPSGTKVSVGIKRFGIEELIPFKITRGAIPIESVTSAYMFDEQTGYIAFDCFSQTTYDEFVSAVRKLRQQGAENLIVDLRDNGGGLLFTVVDLTNEFLEKGDTIVFTKGRNTNANYFCAEGDGMFKELNVCVLINEYSASASEIFAGAMQDNGRGTIIGRRSYGKGVVNEDFPLNDGSTIRLSTKKFYTPSGRCIQKPYNGCLKDYDKELVDRFTRGELSDADSINFPDSLQFVTRTGKIVYGGGGIMPDVFVPLDTTSYSKDFQQITNRGLLFEYAFNFSDKQRTYLESLSKKDALDFCTKNITFNKVISYAENKNITFKNTWTDKEIQLIEKLTRCYTMRNIFGNEYFYELYNVDDETILRAIEEFKK